MSVITDPLTTPADLDELQQRLLGRVARFRRQVRALLALEGVARVMVELVAAAIVSLLLDRTLRLSLYMRLIALAIGVVFLIVELWRCVIVPLRVRLGPIDLAAVLDRVMASRAGRPEEPLSARVASVLQLPQLLASAAPPSAAMVHRAIRRCHESLDAVHFEQHVDRRRLRLSAIAIALSLLIPAVAVLAAPSVVGLWARRWFAGSNEPWPQATYLQVAGLADGRLVIPRGEAFALRVSPTDGSVDPASVSLRFQEAGADRITAIMTRFGPRDFRYDLPPLQAPARVEVWGGDDAPGPFTVEPIDRPRVVQMELRSQHPRDAAPQTYSFFGPDAEPQFLAATKLDLTFSTNVPVDEARVKSSVPHPGPADVRRLDDQHFALSWTQASAVQLQIELVGTGPHLTSIPVLATIGLKQDLPPHVGMTFTGVRQRITPRAQIPLTIEARDDYGVARVDLSAAVRDADAVAASSTQPAALQSASVVLLGPIATGSPMQLDLQLQHTFDVGALNAAPGTVLSLQAAGTDDCYQGPQTGRSRVVSFHIVPPDELFREILLRQQGERARFRKAIDEAQQIHDQLMTLATPQAAVELDRRYRSMHREVLRISASLRDSVTEMKLNALGGQEAWDLVDKNVLTPFKQLLDGPMSRQRDALDVLRSDDAQEVVAATAAQETIVSSMQEILRQMAQWDSFVDVLNQLNEIIRLEQHVHETTEQMDKSRKESIFDK